MLVSGLSGFRPCGLFVPGAKEGKGDRSAGYQRGLSAQPMSIRHQLPQNTPRHSFHTSCLSCALLSRRYPIIAQRLVRIDLILEFAVDHLQDHSRRAVLDEGISAACAYHPVTIRAQAPAGYRTLFPLRQLAEMDLRGVHADRQSVSACAGNTFTLHATIFTQFWPPNSFAA
jgi:hypothetical protein